MDRLNRHYLLKFIDESNGIEGIYRPTSMDELTYTEHFLDLPTVSVVDLENLVNVYQPGAILRRKVGADVMIGLEDSPPGGPGIEPKLLELLKGIRSEEVCPHHAHVQYEKLHPFTDGNGRSGRTLWAWQMLREKRWPQLALGFLHAYYYQTLAAAK